MTFVIEFVAYFFLLLLFLDFVLCFNQPTKKRGDFTFLFLLLTVAFLFFGRQFFSDSDPFSVLLLFSLSVAFAITLYNGRILLPTVSVLIFFAITLLLRAGLAFLLSLLVEGFEAILADERSPIRSIFLLILLVLIFTVCRILLRILRPKQDSEINIALFAALPLVTLIGLSAVLYITVSFEDVLLQILLPGIGLAFFLCNVFFYGLILKIRHLQRSRYQMELLDEKIRFEKLQHEEAAAIWENVRSMKHDMRHHYAVILAQLRAGEVQKCEEYVQELLPNVERIGRIAKTDTPILDYIINSKLSALKNVDIILAGSIGSLEDIEPTELASMIGNILDNAIDALNGIPNETPKRLELLFSKHNSDRVILCRNTIVRSVLETNRVLASTKPGDDHGFGHKVVERIVKKYDGMIDYFEEDGMFGVQIILPCPTE